MRLEECTKTELINIIRNLLDPETVEKKLNDIQRYRKESFIYLQKQRNDRMVGEIYDVRDFKGSVQEMPRYIGAVEAAEKISEKTDLSFYDLFDVLVGIPDAEVKEVVHGQWEYDDGLDLVCSVCGELAMTRCYEAVQHRSRYCPGCGAKMDGETMEE